MSECVALNDRMLDVLHRGARWSPADEAHLVQCADCAGTWRLLQVGAGLDAGLRLDSDRIASTVLARLRATTGVVPIRRLPWRHFAIGLAAAASVALAVWLPGRSPAADLVAVMPDRIGPSLPQLSAVTDAQLDRVSQSIEHRIAEGVPGTVPHLGDLTESDLEQLSELTESP